MVQGEGYKYSYNKHIYDIKFTKKIKGNILSIKYGKKKNLEKFNGKIIKKNLNFGFIPKTALAFFFLKKNIGDLVLLLIMIIRYRYICITIILHYLPLIHHGYLAIHYNLYTSNTGCSFFCLN